SLVTALAALVGVVLSGFGILTPLVGTCGDLLPGPLSRAQAGFPHPNLLANFCVFAYGVVAREDSGLSRPWRPLLVPPPAPSRPSPAPPALLTVPLQPLRPWELEVRPGPSVRLEAARSSLATLAAHPWFGSGLGS